MIELIRSLHDGMSATVMVGGRWSEPFLVQNGGLHQGCTIAPTLFILHFGLVIDSWLSRCIMLQVWKRSLSLVGGWLERELGD